MTRQEILKVAKPILFNVEMVRAILDDRKTATRRPIKVNTKFLQACRAVENPVGLMTVSKIIRPPYKVGDYLYVRETWTPFCINKSTCVNALLSHSDFCFKASLDSKIYGCCDTLSCKWRPSIHMPKAAARIFLRVTDVRVERLQDITKDGAIAEGAETDEYLDYEEWATAVAPPGSRMITLRDYFSELWDSTVKKSDLAIYGWDANPWVWVITFERVEVEP